MCWRSVWWITRIGSVGSPSGRSVEKHGSFSKPSQHHEAILRAVPEAGAGWIGNYSHCAFNLDGQGTFLTTGGTTGLYIGEQGNLERVKECTAGVAQPPAICMKARQQGDPIQVPAIAAMLAAAHISCYEEVAYEGITLSKIKGRCNHTYMAWGSDSGVWKRILPCINWLSRWVKDAYQIPALRLVGDPTRSVSRVALLGGAGSRYAATAIAKGADAYITGDIDYHTAQDVLRKDWLLLDPGHQIEHFVVERAFVMCCD